MGHFLISLLKTLSHFFHKYIFNYKINIDKENKKYYNKGGGSNIEIFTIKEYELYKEKYHSIEINLGDNEEKYQYAEVNHPHDKIFRKALANKKESINIINRFLENEDKISANDITEYNSSYISNKLRNSEADIVYKLKNEDVFFLIEHQTKIDYSMPYRILEYELLIMDSVIINTGGRYKNKKYRYPVVIPIVLYTGNKKWNAELDLSKILLEKWKKYKGEELSKYNVLDANEMENEKLLKENSIISKLILIEKSRTKEEFYDNVDKISKEFKTKEIIYTKDAQKFFVNALMTITQNLFEDVDVYKKIKEIDKEVDDPMMQVLEMLKRDIYKANQEAKEEARKEAIKEGKREGIKEGRIEEQIKIIKNMLKENIPLSVISSVFGITQSEIKKLVR